MTLDAFARGRTALVTGSSGGIGADLARQLGAAGAHVVLVARTEAALEAVAEQIRAAGGRATVVAADLEAPGAAAALAARLPAALGGEAASVLVNNAGWGAHEAFAEHTAEAVRGMVALNVAALTELTHALLPGIVARRGGVLNVASVAAHAPVPGFAVYAATKAYVRSFSAALHAELRPQGVRVTCLSPGPVATGFGARAGVGASFFSGGLPPERVAREGLDGLAAGRREVVPGGLNRAQTLAARLVPTGVTMAVARAVMRR